MFYFEGAGEKANEMKTTADYIRTFIMGPSWLPGSSRTGRELDSSAVSIFKTKFKYWFVVKCCILEVWLLSSAFFKILFLSTGCC